MSKPPKRRALVADDDESMRELVTIALQRAGFAVDAAVDGDEALECFGTGERYALVVLDVNMPRLGGLDALAEIRRRSTAVPVIVASGDWGNERPALDGGATSFIVKVPTGMIEVMLAEIKKLGLA